MGRTVVAPHSSFANFGVAKPFTTLHGCLSITFSFNFKFYSLQVYTLTVTPAIETPPMQTLTAQLSALLAGWTAWIISETTCVYLHDKTRGDACSEFTASLTA